MYDDKFLQETLHLTFENGEYYNVPKAIIRFDYANSHGWWVRITRDGTIFRKLFSDRKNGSISNALKEAIRYRHEILSSFPVTTKQVHPRSLPIEAEKRATRHVEKGKKQPYVFWRARWYNKDHEIQREKFSVLKYGEEEAKALALEAATVQHNKKPKLTKNPDLNKNHDFNPISRADVEVLASISSTPKSSNSNKSKEIINDDPFAFEGERRLELHKSIERNRQLRKQKVEIFLEEHKKLFCELCSFNFIETYPFLSTDIIEVHHILPLASLSKRTIVNIKDLMLLCSNCHFAVHQGDAEDNLLLGMEYFESLQSINEAN